MLQTSTANFIAERGGTRAGRDTRAGCRDKGLALDFKSKQGLAFSTPPHLLPSKAKPGVLHTVLWAPRGAVP